MMHTVSVLIGAAFPYLLSRNVTEIICVVLFLGFGIFMIYQAMFENDEDVSDSKLLNIYRSRIMRE